MLLNTTLVLILALVQPPASAAPVSGAASVNAVGAHVQKHPKQKLAAARQKPAAARDVNTSTRSATTAAIAKAPAPPVVKPAAKAKAATPAARSK
ncbi:MAG TPA: hypothetical protein VGE27_09510 [Gemmatimonas sp.]|uniref:hypothetical protein n=1 Tax=Gemmatimonas sp. TaxID=1962908 RepID=UPI002ED9D443